MIYRKWSLLTGPVTILAVVVGTVVVANYLFVKNAKDSFLKPERKEYTQPLRTSKGRNYNVPVLNVIKASLSRGSCSLAEQSV